MCLQKVDPNTCEMGFWTPWEVILEGLPPKGVKSPKKIDFPARRRFMTFHNFPRLFETNKNMMFAEMAHKCLGVARDHPRPSLDNFRPSLTTNRLKCNC